jgi:SAM-dependent methyltransferase
MTSLQTKESAAPEFNLYAEFYEQLLEDPLRQRFARDPLHFYRRKWSLIQLLLKRAGVDPRQQRWLDVGCGQGEMLRIAGSSFAQASGCDPSAGMLASCTSSPVREQPSPSVLPYEDGSMDFVTAVCVYHHVHGNDRALLMREVRRVLAPGGLYCIVEHNPWNPITQTIVRRCPVDIDAELLTPRRARRLLVAAGFEVLGSSYFLYLPESLFGRFGAVESALEHVPLGGQYALLARAPI